MVEKLERDSMREGSRWRRWGGYALGIIIESAAVGAISLVAFLVMYLIKLIVK
jgi:hypothetical protein